MPLCPLDALCSARPVLSAVTARAAPLLSGPGSPLMHPVDVLSGGGLAAFDRSAPSEVNCKHST